MPLLGSVEVGFFITVQYIGQKLACFRVSHSVKQSTVASKKQEAALKSVTLSECREEKVAFSCTALLVRK